MDMNVWVNIVCVMDEGTVLMEATNGIAIAVCIEIDYMQNFLKH